MVKGNKGEWSEFYAFLKLLADRKIDAADENLMKLEDNFYPILKIQRNETNAFRNYEFIGDSSLRISDEKGEVSVVDISDLKTKTAKIFENIKFSPERTFSIPISEELMDRLKSTHLSAGNSKKEDIVLKIHDKIAGITPELGFSIKSLVGGAPSLLNASKATSFIYEITGIDPEKIKKINAIDTRTKLRDRLNLISELGGRFKFVKVNSEIFKANLQMIDAILPEIIAELLLAYYLDAGSTIPELVEYLGGKNLKILSFNFGKDHYEFKIKGLLHNIALGMVPASRWNGVLRAHGGYIIVREDGELVCYNAYNLDQFRDYLFRNTKFETPSTTRHDYGYIYMEEGKMFMKLNFQIRFIS